MLANSMYYLSGHINSRTRGIFVCLYDIIWCCVGFLSVRTTLIFIRVTQNIDITPGRGFGYRPGARTRSQKIKSIRSSFDAALETQASPACAVQHSCSASCITRATRASTLFGPGFYSEFLTTHTTPDRTSIILMPGTQLCK